MNIQATGTISQQLYVKDIIKLTVAALDTEIRHFAARLERLEREGKKFSVDYEKTTAQINVRNTRLAQVFELVTKKINSKKFLDKATKSQSVIGDTMWNF